MICPSCHKEHDGSYSKVGHKFCSANCYQRDYQRRKNKNKGRGKIRVMSYISLEDAWANLVADMISLAIKDAFDKNVSKATRREAKEWIPDTVPYLLSCTRDMDREDIEVMRKELKLWVKVGCPQDGSWAF